MKKKSIVKTVLMRFASIVFGLLIGLVVAEIGSRFYAFGWDAFCFEKVHSFVPIGYSGYIQPAEDQYVWYELKPNVEGTFKLNPIRTNSQGLRDQEYSFEKPEGTYRVAVIGDSYTFGDGVEADEVYHAVMEEQLNRLSDSLRFEFINFGLAGYDLLNYLGNMEAKAMAYDPDLILIGFCGNNDDDLPEARQYTDTFTGYRHAKWSWFIRHMHLVRMVGNYVSARGRLASEGRFDEKHRRKVAFVREMFGEFGRVRDESGVPIMVSFLDMQDAGPWKVKLVSELCEEHGFEFVDTSPTVEKLGNIEPYWFHPNDHHPNPAMHRIYADVLLKEFLEINLPEFVVHSPQSPVRSLQSSINSELDQLNQENFCGFSIMKFRSRPTSLVSVIQYEYLSFEMYLQAIEEI